MKKIVITMALLTVLAGCGQKGALYLPEKQQTISLSKNTTSDTPTETLQEQNNEP